MVTLSTRVLHPFINSSFVIKKTSPWCSFTVTKPAMVLHPFMDCSHVLTKTTLWFSLWSHFLHLYPLLLCTAFWCCFNSTSVSICFHKYCTFILSPAEWTSERLAPGSYWPCGQGSRGFESRLLERRALILVWSGSPSSRKRLSGTEFPVAQCSEELMCA